MIKMAATVTAKEHSKTTTGALNFTFPMVFPLSSGPAGDLAGPPSMLIIGTKLCF